MTANWALVTSCSSIQKSLIDTSCTGCASAKREEPKTKVPPLTNTIFDVSLPVCSPCFGANSIARDVTPSEQQTGNCCENTPRPVPSNGTDSRTILNSDKLIIFIIFLRLKVSRTNRTSYLQSKCRSWDFLLFAFPKCFHRFGLHRFQFCEINDAVCCGPFKISLRKIGRASCRERSKYWVVA